MPAGVANKSWEQDKDGYASLPQGPGLGVEMDEGMIAKVNADPKKKFRWPTPKLLSSRRCWATLTASLTISRRTSCRC